MIAFSVVRKGVYVLTGSHAAATIASVIAMMIISGILSLISPRAMVDKASKVATSAWMMAQSAFVEMRRSRPAAVGRTSTGRFVDRLVDRMINGALRQLPEDSRSRYAEEWAGDRSQLRGKRLLWWALWLRATASRTSREL